MEAAALVKGPETEHLLTLAGLAAVASTTVSGAAGRRDPA
jgi:endonuclease-3